MEKHARVVVIGGGVVGVSTLYHLVRKGWTDVMLIERRELTSGSTWHAAGLLPLFNMSYSVGQLHKYSVQSYGQLGAETDRDIGLRRVSNIRLATNEDRMDEYRQYAGVAGTIGVQVNFLTPEQVLEAWPLINTDGLVGAIQHPDDGYVQPADLTQAYAAGARVGGARIHRHTTVTAIDRLPDKSWRVTTDKGEVHCEHVVSATGSFARQTGAMIGLDIPVIPVEHQYIVTESHPAILQRKRDGLPEMGVLRGSDGGWYMREEAGGLILGPYEVGAPACYVDGPHEQAEYELFQEDLDRLEPHIESAIHRVPAFGEVGVKQVYNGAIAYTPDGNPIIGPAWGGNTNFWLNEGHSFGITAAGGAGWQLAEWIVEGQPSVDMLGVDPRRYGDYASKAFLVRKNEETYANVFTTHYPDEERPAARPLRTAPCYDRLKAMGAVFGSRFGWERANWFAPPGTAAIDDWSFRRSKWFDHVGSECRHVASHVGLLDMTPFAKARLSGRGAYDFLNYFVANKLPRTNGRVGLCHSLAPGGGVHSEFTIQRESDDSFYLVSGGALQRLDHDWLLRHMPNDGSVRFQNLTSAMGVLVVTGPKARDVLQPICGADLSNDAFAWLTGQQTTIGLAPVKLLRINFVGELGWEIHHDIEYQNHIFDAIVQAGELHGIKPFGMRAMDSMRIEKSYALIGTEMSIEYPAYESGLDRFLRPDKGDFLGREALIARRDAGLQNNMVTLRVDGHPDADPLGNNPLFAGDELVGRTTSGNFGFRVGYSLAMAMVKPAFAAQGTTLGIEILGTRCRATVVINSPYDTGNELLRS